MPRLFIRAHNATFHSCDEGDHYVGPEIALALAVEGALDIAADEINLGHRSAAVEVSIEQEDGTCVLRSVVAISVSPLAPAKAGQQGA